MTDVVIALENVTKSFGDHEVLKGVNVEIRRGEVVSVIGASGSGKSTMLRCINLLETPDGGDIKFNGASVFPPIPIYPSTERKSVWYSSRSTFSRI